jgi:hypothetical protein
VGPRLCRLYLLDLELEPVALLEMMDAPIEREQELEPILGLRAIHIIS